MNRADPAYLQLYRQLRQDITSGIFTYGQKIPSKRNLSDRTGSSVVTVAHALSLLEEEGYIESRQRSGCYVCYREGDAFPVGDTAKDPAALQSAEREDSGTLQAAMKHSAVHSAESESADALCPAEKGRLTEQNWQENDLQTLEVSALEEGAARENPTGEIRPEFSFAAYARTVRRVLSEYGEKIMEKCPGAGLRELRSAIAAYLGRSRDIVVTPEQIIVGSGSEYLYGLVVQMLGRERIFALEKPSYSQIRAVYEANGVQCRMLQLGRDGILSEKLRDTPASVLHVTPFHSYPSGVTASASKRGEYIRWAAAGDRYIIEDDFDSEFSMSGRAESTLFSLEPRNSVIYMNTFSQTISSSVRIGYMVLPAEKAQQLSVRIGFYTCSVPVFDQYVLMSFLNSGEFERHINRVRRMRRAQRKENKKG